MRNPRVINRTLLQKGDRILVALSGGADSVCLLHALCALRPELELTVAAAHYIHGIRPEAAAAELALVRALCARLDVPLTVGRGDVPAYAARNRMGLEEAARTLRYAFLYETLDALGFDKLATAHNLSDNAETVLLDLTRGAGLRGFAGIPEQDEKLIRPLLRTGRAEIEAYDSANDLPYVIDGSNGDTVYSRNRIRKNVLPELRAIDPAADRAILRASNIAREALDFIEQAALARLDVPREPASAPVSVLQSAHPALLRPMVRRLMTEAGDEGRRPDAQRTEAVRRLLASPRRNARIQLGGGYEMTLRGEELTVERAGEEPTPDGEVTLEPGKPVCWNGWEIELGGTRGVAFEEAKLTPPFVVRARRPGDVLARPWGHKNVKKYMNERKIAPKTRDRFPLICDNKGVLLIGDLAKDSERCYKQNGKPFLIYCGRYPSDDE